MLAPRDEREIASSSAPGPTAVKPLRLNTTRNITCYRTLERGRSRVAFASNALLPRELLIDTAPNVLGLGGPTSAGVRGPPPHAPLESCLNERLSPCDLYFSSIYPISSSNHLHLHLIIIGNCPRPQVLYLLLASYLAFHLLFTLLSVTVSWPRVLCVYGCDLLHYTRYTLYLPGPVIHGF